MSVFEGRGLSCIRGERRVFEGLDFALPAGGALVLVGPNGSGKSSLLRLMAGLLHPAAGRLLWDGRPVAEDAEAFRARLRYVGHAEAVKPVLSAAENVAFWAGLQGAGPDEAGDGVMRALAGFDLEYLAEVPGRMLSAGQRRRVALARLLSGPADLWLLDEPTVGLDRAARARLDSAIAAQRAAGGRVALATHGALDIPDAETLDLGRFAVRAPAFDPEAGW
ncbi:MAG TPA: heme ABC exporter ATP-binding protein CcmA [Kiloniellales bacterium]|nr:heme ABC exporter ATP-binding protein CcmA [Kiloniellales bacterium]